MRLKHLSLHDLICSLKIQVRVLQLTATLIITIGAFFSPHVNSVQTSILCSRPPATPPNANLNFQSKLVKKINGTVNYA